MCVGAYSCVGGVCIHTYVCMCVFRFACMWKTEVNLGVDFSGTIHFGF